MIKKIALLLVVSLTVGKGIAQQTTVYTEANLSFKEGMAFFDEGLFGKAMGEFEKTMDLLKPINEPEAKLLMVKAELGYAKCAVQLELPDGEKLILDFIRKYDPDPLANQALIDIANYYYNARDYDRALEYFSRVPTSGMTRDQKSEVRFRMGYANFVNKEFSTAKSNFREISNIENKYFYPTNYYLGLTYFFEGNYGEAAKSFRVAEKSSKYKQHIPYYIVQIYFAEARYDELIAYATPRLKDSKVRKKKEIQQLVGQSFFEKGDYGRALPYLKYYADNTSKLRQEEFYQLGYAQYQTGDYRGAIRSFKELDGINSELGQHAMFYLGDANLKVGAKSTARSAFGKAKRLEYDPDIKEEAQFNYAKLSYELKDPREAIIALQSFPPNSQYYNEAQKLMSEIFISYRDYRQAIQIIERMPESSKTPQIQESYQKVTFFRGLQLIQDNSFQEAGQHFEKSLQFPIDPKIKAQSVYWLADIAHKEEQYRTSIRLTDQFLTLAKTMSGLPDESSIFTANYLQGYNYLKQKNYSASVGFFRDAAEGIQRNYNFIRNEAIRNDVLGDATLRTGDSYFKRNRYNDAVRYYDLAINRKYSNYVYAIYQKALIEGLRGKTTDKILALEQLIDEFPESQYADDALFSLGTTYQEIGQLSNAVPPLQQLVRRYKSKSDLVNQALIKLGLVTYNQGNLDAAIGYYKQVFSNNPTSGEANLALAALEEIYVDDLGQADEYFAFLETIPGYKLDNFARDSINFIAAETQFENANYERAVVAFTDYLRKFPRGRYLLEAHYHRGESHSVLRQYSQALSDYEWVVGRGPSRYYLKGLEKAAIIAYNHEQNFAKAFDLYQQLELSASTEDMRFEAQLGGLRSAYRVNNTQAVFDLANKVSNNPNATTEQKSTANFYIGKIAFDRQDYSGALASFDEVIRLSDNEQTAEARYLKAYIYYLRRDLETAQTQLINANKESSAYPYWVAKSVILLSDVLAEKGDLYNARAALEALLENYNEDPELITTAQNKLNQLNSQINQASRLAPNVNRNTLEMENETGNNNNNN